MPRSEIHRILDAEAWYRDRLTERSGADRLCMACDMFDTAVALLVAGLPDDEANDWTARRLAVLRRMYAPDHDQPFMNLVVERIRAHDTSGSGD